MLRALLARLPGWDPRNDDEGDASDGERGGFARSVLDASVLYGHGQGDPKAAREMAEIRDEAAKLSEQEQFRE